MKRRHRECRRNCYFCDNCTYIGDGGYMCDVDNSIVIDDWEPTEDFFSCFGKEFVSIED